MKTQNQVKRILSQPEAIAHIRSMLDGNADLTRTAISDELQHICRDDRDMVNFAKEHIYSAWQKKHFFKKTFFGV